MASREAQFAISLILTLLAGAVYTLASFGAMLASTGHHGRWIEAVIATAIPLVVLWLIYLGTRRTAPAIWKGAAIGMIFVVLLCGLCNGAAVVMSSAS